MSTGKYIQGIDRKFNLPRIWSNAELRKHAPFFKGEVINVSGWKDEDKEGKRYSDYFVNKAGYTISNYKTEQKGVQDLANEIELNLEEPLKDSTLIGKFDVVFNHTVLEHIYNFRNAFDTICDLSNDIVILVVPFLQQMHGFYHLGGYGDYWRFSPNALERMFSDKKMQILYLSYNDEDNASVYIYCVASKNASNWDETFQYKKQEGEPTRTMDGFRAFAGCNVINNGDYIRRKKGLNGFRRFVDFFKRKFC